MINHKIWFAFFVIISIICAVFALSYRGACTAMESAALSVIYTIGAMGGSLLAGISWKNIERYE